MDNLQNNLILCKGKVIAGNKNQVSIFYMTLLMLVMGLLVFCSQIAPIFFIKDKDIVINNKKMEYSNQLHKYYYLIIIDIIVYLGVLYNYIACFFKEPGIIPKNYSPFSLYSRENIQLQQDKPTIYQ